MEKETSQICIEIFAIGNELCYGRIYDTNSFWIADKATQLGARVQRITCIPDDLDIILNSLEEAINRNPSFIIITGGLGPTSDDLTVEALSKLLKIDITTSTEILKEMAKKENMLVEQLSPAHVKMAQTLKGAECLSNPNGWAPVTIIKKGHTTIAALPGPPKETKACFTEYLAKKIREKTNYASESKRVIVKMYESEISPIAEEIMSKIPGTYLKPLVSEYQTDKGLPVEIIVFAENKEACQKKIMEVMKNLERLAT